MKRWWLGAVLAAVSASASAQEKSGEQKVAFEKRAFPFEAEVSAERLNVRLFPKADQTSVIVSVLSLGEKVTVVGEREDFFQILPVRGCTAWIFGRNVQREGDKGVVTADDVPVRMDSRVNADVLCTLKQGDAVKILSEHMGWYKIEAPASVKYYVGKKYVRPGKELPAPVAAAVADEAAPRKGPQPRAAGGDAEAREKLAQADQLLEEQRRLVDAQKLDDVDFGGVVAAYEGALAAAQTPALRAEAERGLKRYKELHLIWMTHRARKAEEELRLAREREKLAQKPEEPPARTFALSGYVDTCGLLWKRPGSHKLVMGGKIVGFLRVKDGDDKMIARLNDLYQKYVGVNGVVIKNPEGWDGYSVVVVDEIVPLTQD
ncbi:MAG TPA: SH3 domain-containing protein [Planctomycetota bacterium]|jgi:uncharacterized protein YgiM (DUF1202 family)|nr:SH3 domain-containing protein [Planctomycetota bacterium]